MRLLDFIHYSGGRVKSLTCLKLVSTSRVTLFRKEGDLTTRVALLTEASDNKGTTLMVDFNAASEIHLTVKKLFI